MLTSHAQKHDTADRGFSAAMIIQRDSTDLIAWIKKLGIHPTGHGKQIKGASGQMHKRAQKSYILQWVSKPYKSYLTPLLCNRDGHVKAYDNLHYEIMHALMQTFKYLYI